MELDNVDVLLGMTIASIILGIGISMFFMHSYTGYGAVILAIGMMTLALTITARPRVIERVKREIVLQPSRQAEPPPKTASDTVIPSTNPSQRVSNKNQSEQPSATTTDEQAQTVTTAPPQEINPEQKQSVEPTQPTQPQLEEKVPEKPQEEPIPVAPTSA
jgi:predicted lipid-binding transport protein (Tim44 family)